MISVFIYDDNKARVESLMALLSMTESTQGIGFAFNCKHVLEDMASAKPDIVLMDIEMPFVNGLQGVEIIHRHFPEIKVIMQTVFEDKTKIFQAIKVK